MSTKQLKALAAGAALLAVGYGIARAQTAPAPHDYPLYYSGRMLGADGAPLEGEHDLTVRVFDGESAAKPVCETTATALPLQDGRFRASLNRETCAPAFRSGAEAWVQVQVDREEPLPRARVGAVPYAVAAERAGHAHSAGAAESMGEIDTRLRALESQLTALQARVGTASGVLAEVNTAMAAPDARLNMGVEVRGAEACTTTEHSYTDCACASGSVAVAGGAYALGSPAGWIEESQRLDNPALWRVACANANGRFVCTRPHVVCVKASTP